MDRIVIVGWQSQTSPQPLSLTPRGCPNHNPPSYLYSNNPYPTQDGWAGNCTLRFASRLTTLISSPPPHPTPTPTPQPTPCKEVQPVHILTNRHPSPVPSRPPYYFNELGQGRLNVNCTMYILLFLQCGNKRNIYQ